MATDRAGEAMEAFFTSRVGDAEGSCLVQRLAWDSDFFGFPCGRVENLIASGDNRTRFSVALDLARRTRDWAEAHRIRFVVVKIPGPDPILVQALEATGFYLTDNTMALAWRPLAPSEPPDLPPDFVLSEKNSDPDRDAAAFSRLFTDGRFHNDRRIPSEQADRLWQNAVLTQLRGEATQALFLLNHGRPVGLTTVKTVASPPDSPSTRTGCVFIVGLHPEYRGRGLGKALLIETMRRTEGRYERIEVEN